jgi:acetate kinase
MSTPTQPSNDPNSGLNVLALNSGSSSLKFGLYRVGPARADMLLSGEAQSVGDGGGEFCAKDAEGRQLVSETTRLRSARDTMLRIGKLIDETAVPAPAAVGHRVVHGGPTLTRHCLIDASVVEQLEGATVFAPLHMPAALSVIRLAQMQFAGLPQAACFDTAFHAALPDVARTLPIPRVLRKAGVRRYGFHGLSCESIMRQLKVEPPDRVVIAHLGNGASITAVKAGRSVDTSMGLTPTGGLIMGTRSGDLDPGVLVYLMRSQKLDATMAEDLIDQRSGLLGISGLSGDMRVLHQAAATNPDARLAVEMFCYSVRKQLVGMIAVLGGADLIVFTGGIGENDGLVRADICNALTWIGVEFDEERNRSGLDPLSTPASRCEVRVLASQEDQQIARHTWSLVARGCPDTSPLPSASIGAGCSQTP